MDGWMDTRCLGLFILHKNLMFIWFNDRIPTCVVILIGTRKNTQSEDNFF